MFNFFKKAILQSAAYFAAIVSVQIGQTILRCIVLTFVRKKKVVNRTPAIKPEVQLEQLETKITQTLQQIDSDFAKATQIVAQILPKGLFRLCVKR